LNILGISCHYHDSSACLLKDGQIVAAAQEERFNREVHSAVFPIQAINYCVQEAGISFLDIDYVAFYELPYLRFHRVVLNHLCSWPLSFPNFLSTMPSWLQERLIIPLLLEEQLGYKRKTFFVPHHLSHAASAFLVSPFEEAAILTADSVGEWACTTCGTGRGNQITLNREMRYPDSLGLLYTALTTFLGFAANSGEGKVMGLAAYGKPTYLDKFKEMTGLRKDGSISIDQSYFGFNTGNRMYSRKFVKEFGLPRAPGDVLDERHADLACSVQALIEDVLLIIARNLHKETGLDKLCLAGGLFLNCVANRKILDDSGFKEIFVQPAAGDAGTSVGAASYIYNTVLGNPRKYVMEHASLGPSYQAAKIARIVINRGLKSETLSDEDFFPKVVSWLAENKVMGWFQGRMEFGPRALGNRSILANPCDPHMKDTLNLKIKKREPFRPFAPIVTEEDASTYFEMDYRSPFMLIAAPVRADKRDMLPAITHIDGTARVQTVSLKTQPRLHRLLKEFEKVSGVPVLLNTSFNQSGEPIVCTPENAIDCFERTKMDCLCLENIVVTR
jgi:carbamoyltransferase